MDIHKISVPTPYGIGDVNAYLLKGDALTLIDAGPKTVEAYDALRWGIKAAGYDLTEVEQVILTHHHPDHAGWVDAFPNSAIMGHRYVDYWLRLEEDFLTYREQFYLQELQRQGVSAPYIEKIMQVRGEMELFGTLPLTHFLAEGDEVPGHPSLQIYETLGHAQSHLIFLDEQTNECIGGDLLLNKVSSNPLVEPPQQLQGERPKSLLQYNDSLRRLSELSPIKIYGGHGDEVENVKELVTERLQQQQDRAMKVLTLLQEPLTVAQTAEGIFGKTFHKQPGLTLSETLGQLDYLQAGDYVTIEQRDGVDYYKKA